MLFLHLRICYMAFFPNLEVVFVTTAPHAAWGS